MRTASSRTAKTARKRVESGRPERDLKPASTVNKAKNSAQLLLWRHAQAEEGEDDAARPLTPRGRKQALRVARWLEARLPDHYRLIASPAVRAQQTAQALSRRFQTDPELSVDSSPRRMLASIGWPEASGTTLLVGHQPSLGALAALLVAGRSESWNIRKGALWWLERRDGGVSIRTVIDPSLI